MAVAFMMFIKELRRNGGQIRRYRRKPPNAAEFFLPFLAELYISELFEPNLFLSKKNTLTFALKTCDFFWLFINIFEILLVSNTKMLG